MYKGKTIVLLDVDDVVCRCVLGMVREATAKTGVKYTEEDMKTWDVFGTMSHPDHPDLKQHIEGEMRKKGWCQELEPFPGAVVGVKSLQAISDVYFVTAPFDGEHWEYERRVWLQDHFSIPRWRIIQGSSKFLVRGDYFVDDKVENCLQWQEYEDDGKALLWQRPHNRHHPEAGKLEQVSSWDDLYARIAGGV